ncbi:hypothetical protein [Thalassospira sp. GB04J01]|uniref:hypothetical protein n=1 Tax=Thalassospira sp. GB04J01 TaxID=1485225 RepID=UPI000C9BAFE2|nr:hypothetical protein [Thalassospira sp. GB04J01]|tara:strand:+ start:301062 stop:301349 length:288 start_codon:yes stop_codon:yes gene_type:complete
MGNILKILAVLEMVAAIALAIMTKNHGPQMAGCQGIEDILARIDCEEMTAGIMTGLSSGIVYILVGGAVGAIVLYALGHIVTLVEDIHRHSLGKS